MDDAPTMDECYSEEGDGGSLSRLLFLPSSSMRLKLADLLANPALDEPEPEPAVRQQPSFGSISSSATAVLQPSTCAAPIQQSKQQPQPVATAATASSTGPPSGGSVSAILSGSPLGVIKNAAYALQTAMPKFPAMASGLVTLAKPEDFSLDTAAASTSAAGSMTLAGAKLPAHSSSASAKAKTGQSSDRKDVDPVNSGSAKGKTAITKKRT